MSCKYKNRKKNREKCVYIRMCGPLGLHVKGVHVKGVHVTVATWSSAGDAAARHAGRSVCPT